jgi:hypothetical protein
LTQNILYIKVRRNYNEQLESKSTPLGEFRTVLKYGKHEARGGFIGGCTGVRAPVGLGQQGCKGGAKNQIRKYGIISFF